MSNTSFNDSLRDPRQVVANLDLIGTRIIAATTSFVEAVVTNDGERIIQNTENLSMCIGLLRMVRDGIGALHGIEQTTDESMELIRDGLVAEYGVEAIQRAEETGKMPASMVADQILADLELDLMSNDDDATDNA